ncbi:integrase core domain-containing protein [Glutamicibacter endophyticus]|uniref:integrase core domain-containing protein n=1 Tax=Glutamicibacter endophyticus TaxID=1522174 RepID=UPI003AF07AE5
MSESFWSAPRTEFHGRYLWANRAEMKQKAARWIEDFYNHHRLYSSLKMGPPVEFAQQLKGRSSLGNRRETLPV